MTEREIIDVCRDFFDEMYNGGFQFVLINSHPYVMQIPQYLRAIGASEMANTCQKALSVFPEPLPLDAEERMDYLSDFEEDHPDLWEHLDICNDQFNELDQQLEACLGRFIDLHFPAPWLSRTDLKAKSIAQYYRNVAGSTFGPHGGVQLWWDNQAYHEIEKLNQKLYARLDKGFFIARNLLRDKNPSIRYHIAVYCLKAQIHVDSAKRVLTQIEADRSLNGGLRIAAQSASRHTEPYQAR